MRTAPNFTIAGQPRGGDCFVAIIRNSTDLVGPSRITSVAHHQISFWLLCVQVAWRGSVDIANAWAPILGVAIVGGAAYLIVGRMMSVPETFPQLLLFGLACLGGAWIAVFTFRLAKAPAELWRAEKMKVIALEKERVPKISLEYRPECDPCAVRGKTKQGRKAWYYRIRPVVLSAQSIKGCRGQLIRIRRFEETGWIPAPFSDPRALRWVEREFDAIELHADIPQMLDMFYVDATGALRLGDVNESQLGASGQAGTYQFEIAVTGDGCPPARRMIEVELTGLWEQPKIKQISTP